jgi:mRNA interferase RelE/StbE
MVNYKIEFKKSAVKELNSLPKNEIKRVVDKISLLANEPRPAGCTKLSADEKYRIRVGNYRILYQILDEVLLIIIVRLAHRKDVYR